MKKRIVVFFVLLALVFTTMGGDLFSAFAVKASAEYLDSYDSTSIESDLAGTDLSVYSPNALGDCEIISLMEYCYSENSSRSRFYGLYLYVYNPTQKHIETVDGYNKVNMIVSYAENGNNDVSDVSLRYLDKTEDNLFYKFKIDDPRILPMATAYAAKHDGVRRYEITELQLRFADGSKGFAGTIYEWSGYAAHCGKEDTSVSSLSCKNYGGRSIYLSLKQTNYRFEQNEYTFISDELNSVFLTIPEEYFQDFGNLTEIDASWYEYKTDYMFVTSDRGAYSYLWDFRNKEFESEGYYVIDDPDNNSSILKRLAWRVWWERGRVAYDSLQMYLGYFYAKNFAGKIRDDFSDKKVGGNWLETDTGLSSTTVNYIRWLFYSSEVTGSDAYRISKDEVIEYARKYTNTFSGETKIRDKYASSLFVNSIDTDRLQFLADQSKKNGFVSMKFNVNDSLEFVDVDKSQSAWNKFWFGEKYVNKNYSPIVTIREGDLVYDAQSFADKYYVNVSDAESIIADARKAYDNNQRPVLLRFAVTDYYASTAYFDDATNKDFTDADGYVAQQTVFLDFDVLSMSFLNENGYDWTVIGVVADPIDIFNALTPPDDLVEDEPWWQKIIALLLLILLVAFVWPIFSPFIAPIVIGIFKIFGKTIGTIFEWIWKLVTFPFRLIGSAFRR